MSSDSFAIRNHEQGKKHLQAVRDSQFEKREKLKKRDKERREIEKELGMINSAAREYGKSEALEREKSEWKSRKISREEQKKRENEGYKREKKGYTGESDIVPEVPVEPEEEPDLGYYKIKDVTYVTPPVYSKYFGEGVQCQVHVDGTWYDCLVISVEVTKVPNTVPEVVLYEYVCGYLESDDDEEDEKPFDARAFKSVKRSDAAHAGMGRRTNSDDEEEENIEEKAMRLLNEKLG